jgi:hypothetical protein
MRLMHLAKPAFAIAAFAIVLVTARRAEALPQFARKYKMDCSGCHDALAFPRLNDVGYKFRRAGFRMPENIGQDELADYTLDNYFSASVRADNTTNVLRESGATDWLNTFSGEASLFPLTGSFAKYFASETEIAFAPGEGVEIENAYARAVYGGEELWLSARMGIFHPLEGLGGSDRSLGPSRPLILEVPPNNNQDTLLTVAEPSRVGLDIGVQWQNTSLTFEVFNRARIEREDGELAAAGALPDTRSGKDFMVVVNQILGARSGLSAYWLHGNVSLPVDPEMFAAGTSEAVFNDRYDRIAAFASAGTAKLLGLAGAQLAFDQSLDEVTGEKSRFTSAGGFAEGNFGITAHVVCYLRVDYFDPSTDADNDQIVRGTLGLLAWQPMISVVPELRLQRAGDTTEGALVVQARVIY